MNPRRLRLLDAITRTLDAANEAMTLALELEEEDGVASSHPPNVLREAEKTGPRLPFRTTEPPTPRQKSTAYAFTAFTGERALAHVKKAYEEARSPGAKALVLARMRKLVDQGLFSEDDVADYLNPKRRP